MNCDGFSGNSGSGTFIADGGFFGVEVTGLIDYVPDPRGCKVINVYDDAGYKASLPGAQPQRVGVTSMLNSLSVFCDGGYASPLCGRTAVCGDGVCSGGETHASCAGDCASLTCGDHTCSFSEFETCPADCGPRDDSLICNGALVVDAGAADAGPFAAADGGTQATDAGAAARDAGAGGMAPVAPTPCSCSSGGSMAGLLGGLIAAWAARRRGRVVRGPDGNHVTVVGDLHRYPSGETNQAHRVRDGWVVFRDGRRREGRRHRAVELHDGHVNALRRPRDEHPAAPVDVRGIDRLRHAAVNRQVVDPEDEDRAITAEVFEAVTCSRHHVDVFETVSTPLPAVPASVMPASAVAVPLSEAPVPLSVRGVGPASAPLVPSPQARVRRQTAEIVEGQMRMQAAVFAKVRPSKLAGSWHERLCTLFFEAGGQLHRAARNHLHGDLSIEPGLCVLQRERDRACRERDRFERGEPK